jgi:hypothetical protein
MPIRKQDIFDTDIVDAYELASDGYGDNSIYLSTSIVSTITPNIININVASDGNGILYSTDHPVEPNDIAWIYGTLPGGIADGYYTVNSVLSDTSFSINETITSSTGGTVQFRYPAGAKKVGFDPRGTGLSANNVEDAIKQIVSLPSGVGVQIDGVPYGTVGTVNVLTDGFLDAKVVGGILTLSANSFILDIDGSITYINDGDALKKAV